MVAPEPIFEPRGTPLSVVGRLKALSDMGHTVDLATYPIGADVDLPGIHIHRTLSVPGIRKIKIGPSLAKLPLDFLLLLLTIRLLRRQSYDLIHTHEEAGFWGTALSRLFGIPHIYDMHSSLPQQLKNFEFSSSGLLKKLFESLEYWMLKYAGGVITICPDLYDQVVELAPGRGSVLIENVVDYETVFGAEDQAASIKARYDLEDRTVALYAGTFEPYQGLDLLIEAAGPVLQDHPSVVFLMVGGHADQVNAYQEKVRKAGLESKFIFTGQVRPQDVGSYMRCADILLSPRNSGTNTPLKIYSYLKSGIPIVATRLVTHTQVMDDDVAELTEATPQGFAAGLKRLLADREYAARLAGNASRLADCKYSYTVYLEKYQRVIDLASERGL